MARKKNDDLKKLFKTHPNIQFLLIVFAGLVIILGIAYNFKPY